MVVMYSSTTKHSESNMSPWFQSRPGALKDAQPIFGAVNSSFQHVSASSLSISWRIPHVHFLHFGYCGSDKDLYDLYDLWFLFVAQQISK